MDKDKPGLQYPEEMQPNIDSVIPDERKPVLLKVKQLKKLIEKIPLIDETEYYGDDVACDECGGYGEVVWTYKNYEKTFDCPVCDGSGYKSERNLRNTGRKTPDPDASIKIKGVLFKYRLIQKLCDTCNILEQSEISALCFDKAGANLFQVGDVKILLMPLKQD